MDRINILLVDDRPENLISLAAILDVPDYELVRAESGAEALRCLMEREFALILLDVQMPIMDGFETATLIKQRDRTKSIPIIFITANSVDEPFMYRGYGAGAVDYMTKPFNPAVLRSKVSVFAELHRKTIQLRKQAHLELENERLLREREIARRESALLRAEQEANERYRDLVENIQHAIVWTAAPDLSHVSFVSSRSEQILGYPVSEWRDAEFWFKNTHPEDRPRMDKALSIDLPATGEVYLQHRFMSADHRIVWLQTGLRLISSRSDGRPELRGLSVDITHLKNAEIAAREAIQIRDEFLSIASHELKTPLTSLGLHLAHLRRIIQKELDSALVPPRMSRAMESSEQQLKRLGRLIDELLDVTRINNGKFSLELERIRLPEMIREICARYAHDLQLAGCELVLELDDEIEGEWDRLRLEQVVINLITNALKYGRGKPIHVSAQIHDQQAVVQVRDQGIGIAKEDQARIFSQFERAVSSSNFGGLGLGLFIVAKILDAHQGQIEVESEPEQGSTFTFRLPIAIRSEPSEGLTLLKSSEESQRTADHR